MPVNKPNGNMYPYAYTDNPVGGECPHKCGYCYVETKIKPKFHLKKYEGPPRIIEKELGYELRIPDDYILFMCNMIDLFADEIPSHVIKTVLSYCNRYPQTCFLFQTKNPKRFFEFENMFPEKTIFGITLETNRTKDYYKISSAPYPDVRKHFISAFKQKTGCKIMISIEPVIDFDLDVFVEWIRELDPYFVSIGGNSAESFVWPDGWFEPSAEKIRLLITRLQKFTKVRIKSNLERLFDGVKL